MTMAEQSGYEEIHTYAQLVDVLRRLCGFDDLFLLSQDLRSLVSIDGQREIVRNPALIDDLLACRTVAHDAGFYVPLPHNRFPLLVGRSATDPAGEVRPTWAGLLVSCQCSIFEQLETLRRPVSMSVEAQLQWDQLPVRAAQVGGYDIAGILEPAATVAGDMYDIAVTPAGHASAVAMDSMGHGVSATLAASLAMAAVRTARRDGASLAEQVCTADTVMLQEYGGSRFVTMVGVEFHEDRILVVNAGHEPLRRGTPDGGIETLDVPADPPLGLDGPTEYRTHTLAPLEEGESLCMLSDGAPESVDADRVQLGEQGVNRIISARLSASSLQSAHRIGRDVIDYCGSLNDDLTVVVATRDPRPAAAVA